MKCMGQLERHGTFVIKNVSPIKCAILGRGGGGRKSLYVTDRQTQGKKKKKKISHRIPSEKIDQTKQENGPLSSSGVLVMAVVRVKAIFERYHHM